VSMTLTETTREVTTREVLHRAADLLEEFGWCQGQLFSRGRRAYCVIGATARAAHDLGYEGDWTGGYGFVRDRVGADLLRAVSGGWFSGDWNDEPDRTKAEVVAKLREAAEAA
jgi:hypothetical protein